MRKRVIISVGICLVLSLVVGISSYVNRETHVIDHAKLFQYSSVDDVERASDLIVEVQKIDEKPITYNLGEGHYDNLTLSKVKIEKVVKPFSEKKLSQGDTIWIVESQWSDEKNRVVHHTENYLKMAVNKEYRLYLGYNSEVDNYYPVGLLYGKIPMDTAENVFYGELNNDKIKTIVEELRENI